MPLRRPFHITFAWLGLFCFCLVLTGCRTVTVEGEPWVNEAALKSHPPYSIAVLSTTDVTGHPEMQGPMRQGLYDAFSALPYQDTPLDKIDARVAEVSAQRRVPPPQLPPGALALPDLGDCVIFSEIASVDRLYLVLYSRTRIGLNFVMMDTRTRAVLYRNHFEILARSGGPTITILGLAERAFYNMWNLRGGTLPDILLRAARQIAEQIPQPQFRVAGGPQLQIANVTVSAPRNPVGAGDTIKIEVEATANCRSTFSIGKIVQDAPLEETEPGHYRGHYQVQPKDQTPYAVVNVHLQLPGGKGDLNYVADQQPFSIDTNPPTAPHIEKWWPNGREGIYLALVGPEKTDKTGQAPVIRQVIYRREGGHGQFNEVGETSDDTWLDPTTQRGTTYEYYIVTEDAAGNRSDPGPVSQVVIPQ